MSSKNKKKLHEGATQWRRLLPPLFFLLALTLLVVFTYESGYSSLPPTEKRYSEAKAASERLKQDDRRASRRDLWEKSADEFRAVYDSDPTWPNRPAALFRQAESLEELAKRSFAKADARKAAECYELLAARHAESRLADDALFSSARLRAAWLKDDKGALALIARIKSRYPKGDMISQAQALEKALTASADGRTAPEAGQAAATHRIAVEEQATPDAKNREEPTRTSNKTQEALGRQATQAAEQSAKLSVARTHVQAGRRENVRESKPAAGREAGRETKRTAQRDEQAQQSELQVLSWDSLSKDSVEIILELTGPTRYSARLENGAKSRPDRVYLNLENAVVAEEVRKGVIVRGSLLQSVSVLKHKDGSASLRFDFREVRRFDTRVENDPCRIVLNVAAGKTALPRGKGSAAGIAAITSGQSPSTGPASKRPAFAHSGSEQPTANKPVTVDTRRVTDMADQLGLSVRTVFIDAGHGGRDPGTHHNNVAERLITLDVAATLGRLLEANGLEVVYSRKNDAHVSLSERTRMANAARSDLFVSIHVNANADPSVHGFEAYYLDLAGDPQAARTAALENAGSDRRLGDMQSMLADVMLNARTEESRRLAGDIRRLSLFRIKKRGYTVKDNGVKSAPFHVLLGAGMPAVLVELGYCSNSNEARNLADPKYRRVLAEGLAEGILAYKDRLSKPRTAQNSLTPEGPSAM